ncbi:hypothetical protein FEM48_Zijuj01G0230300 [Ziziphus jujuba var. spinosa]|uniref:Uncharacterized protein n=1 Tax=Ziziphus jujuba var. spinosa TaxID=714518 RepID=A0A978W424_ZIZJJ|nr:hypothetical protein FEM48_Zijuj01G0230300 [Ziziphus jujuba var. spinosa]
MGNCLRHESSMTWAGEDWGSPASEKLFPRSTISKSHHEMDKDEGGEREKSFGSYPATSRSGGGSTEVKIKITKKQLEELLGRAAVKDMSVQQVLEQLIRVSDGFGQNNQRSWRPALQSIPE